MSDWNAQIIDQFRANDGEVPRFGRSLVLVHHRGARTGTERVTPVMGIPTPDGWWIAASYAGRDVNPAWFGNLRAHPDVTVETADTGAVEAHEVHAVVLDGADRDAAWEEFKRRSPGFADYETKTDRVIPVVELRRRAGASS